MFFSPRNPPPPPTTGRSPFKSCLIEYASPFHHRRQLFLAVSCPESLEHHWTSALLFVRPAATFLPFCCPGRGRYGSEEQRLIYGRENFIQSNDFSRTIKIGLAPCQVYTLSQCAPSPPGRPRPSRGKRLTMGLLPRDEGAFVRTHYVRWANQTEQWTRDWWWFLDVWTEEGIRHVA